MNSLLKLLFGLAVTVACLLPTASRASLNPPEVSFIGGTVYAVQVSNSFSIYIHFDPRDYPYPTTQCRIKGGVNGSVEGVVNPIYANFRVVNYFSSQHLLTTAGDYLFATITAKTAGQFDSYGSVELSVDMYINGVWEGTFDDETLSITVTNPPTGSLNVTLNPPTAVNAGAAWQLDGGTWYNSGTTVTGLVTGAHSMAFTNVAGWLTPTSQVVTLSNALTTVAIGTYVAIPYYNQISGQLLGDGKMRLSFIGNAGGNYALDRSFSLSPANWIPQTTNPANASGAMLFTNPPDATTNNFWRIRSVP